MSTMSTRILRIYMDVLFGTRGLYLTIAVNYQFSCIKEISCVDPKRKPLVIVPHQFPSVTQ